MAARNVGSMNSPSAQICWRFGNRNTAENYQATGAKNREGKSVDVGHPTTFGMSCKRGFMSQKPLMHSWNRCLTQLAISR